MFACVYLRRLSGLLWCRMMCCAGYELLEKCTFRFGKYFGSVGGNGSCDRSWESVLRKGNVVIINNSAVAHGYGD